LTDKEYVHSKPLQGTQQLLPRVDVKHLFHIYLRCCSYTFVSDKPEQK